MLVLVMIFAIYMMKKFATLLNKETHSSKENIDKLFEYSNRLSYELSDVKNLEKEIIYLGKRIDALQEDLSDLKNASGSRIDSIEMKYKKINDELISFREEFKKYLK